MAVPVNRSISPPAEIQSAKTGGYKNQLEAGYKHEKWIDENADFTPLDNGCDSLVISGQAVMESWEKPLMEAFAEVACRNGGRVLEVGFGLSLASNSIQTHDIDEHVVIEANKDVYKKLEKWATNQKHKTTPMHGLWQDQIKLIEDNSLDGILYDTYPLNAEEQHTHQFDFLKAAWKKLKVGGIMTYCNLTSIGVLKTDHPDWNEMFEKTQKPYLLKVVKEADIKPFEIKANLVPPANCRYYHHTEALIPILIKTKTICEEENLH